MQRTAGCGMVCNVRESLIVICKMLRLFSRTEINIFNFLIWTANYRHLIARCKSSQSKHVFPHFFLSRYFDANPFWNCKPLQLMTLLEAQILEISHFF